MTSNPLVALHKAIQNDNDFDGIIYIFKSGKDFFSETGISQEGKNNLYFLAKAVSALKNVYLRHAVYAVTDHDVIYTIFDSLKALSYLKGFKINYSINKFDEKSQVFCERIFKDSSFQNMLKPMFCKGYDNGVQQIFLDLFGFPIHITPHFNSHEQIVANRIIMQGSSFLLWPNKIIDGETVINNIDGDKYHNRLIKIIIPSGIKSALKNKVDLMYNTDQFYIDTMHNQYS